MGGLGSSAVSCTPPTVPWLLGWMRGRFRWASRLASDGRLDTNQPQPDQRPGARSFASATRRPVSASQAIGSGMGAIWQKAREHGPSSLAAVSSCDQRRRLAGTRHHHSRVGHAPACRGHARVPCGFKSAAGDGGRAVTAAARALRRRWRWRRRLARLAARAAAVAGQAPAPAVPGTSAAAVQQPAQRCRPQLHRRRPQLHRRRCHLRRRRPPGS